MKYSRFISLKPTVVAWVFGSMLAMSLSGPVFASNDTDRVSSESPGVYVSGNGGLGFAPGVDGDSGISYHAGYAAGLGLGYRFGTAFRVEENVSYLSNTGRYAFYDFGSFGVTLSALTAMTNLLYDFSTGKIFPYMGAGVGYAHLWLKLGYDGLSATGTSNDFAYQGIVGLGFHVTPQTTLGVQYRYLRTADDQYYDNVAEAVLSYAF